MVYPFASPQVRLATGALPPKQSRLDSRSRPHSHYDGVIARRDDGFMQQPFKGKKKGRAGEISVIAQDTYRMPHIVSGEPQVNPDRIDDFLSAGMNHPVANVRLPQPGPRQQPAYRLLGLHAEDVGHLGVKEEAEFAVGVIPVETHGI